MTEHRNRSSDAIAPADQPRSPDQARAELERRARALARPVVAPESSQALSLMTFTLHEDTYAVEARAVREVTRLVHLAVLPGAEPPVAGLTLWRGEVLPVLDLGLLSAVPRPPRHAPRTLLVLGGAAGSSETNLVGLVADAPGELRAVPGSLFRAPPAGIAADIRAYVGSMLADGVMVLDVARVWDVIGAESS